LPIALLVFLVWLDATLAQPVDVTREPLPALSVGHNGEVSYRWTNVVAAPRDPARPRSAARHPRRIATGARDRRGAALGDT
jgi:hypothetical protein